ncbi:hydroxyphenylacetyl-CoA thioesterase PaaI [Sulfuricystis multivorans]|uniref:hydroxyphenylacetyl-CoA thioesterase PaaI n=1 Tax=Sulfuricystis multivorans TaxID=2211108 RepID=UPI000F8201C6|nr:hydroxyphenylacetyl-CoA thioesterase PaaI [Sulfuricystis multivorans]
MSAQRIAEKVAEIMWADDHAARGLGIEIVAVGPGAATLKMAVRPDMVNGHGSCHGAFIFAVADATFAYACNSDNQRTVASGADIDFLAPAMMGEVLTATAIRRQQGGRSGLYDVEVVNQDGRLIALFRGRAVRVKGHIFEPA